MKTIFDSAFYIFYGSAVLAIQAGCGGAQMAPGHAAPGSASTKRAEGGRSWMAPDVKNDALLYVSDLETSSVYVYSYRRGKLKGTLTDFSAPHGECVDKAGDVFITNTRAANIIEYPHGGTTPVATIDDPNEYPAGCSVDPTTGNLAVTSLGSTIESDPGDVAVYAGAAGTPKTYTNSRFYSFAKCGYDDKGNLFVDGGAMDGQFEFAELPAGGSALKNVALNQSIAIPGAVQWDGKHVAVEDQGVASEGSTIYQFTVNGSKGTEVGSTALGGSTDVLQSWIHGKTVVGADSGASILFWPYPAGGTAYKTITGVSEPVGATVSEAASEGG